MTRVELSHHNTYQEAVIAKNGYEDSSDLQIRKIHNGFKLVRRVIGSTKTDTKKKVEEDFSWV